jgi:two-component system, chemotaxis family, chemotaxis protein CheY
MTPDRAKLLIVDDSRMIRKVLRNLMQGVGFTTIDEAPDGAAALDLFRMAAYDLVLSDCNMPHVSGLELLRTIRHGTLRRDTAFVLLSGDLTAGRMVEALKAGASAIVAKPFSAPVLCEQVLRIVAALPPVSEPAPLRSFARMHA